MAAKVNISHFIATFCFQAITAIDCVVCIIATICDYITVRLLRLSRPYGASELAGGPLVRNEPTVYFGPECSHFISYHITYINVVLSLRLGFL